jgi:hypothetical protein
MAGSATVGTAVVKLSFDGKGVKSELGTVERDVESRAGSIGGKVKKVSANIGKVLTAAFAAGTAAVVAFSKSSVDAFNTQEKALAKLEQSASNQGWAAGAVEDLKAYNSELQKTGIIGDEVAAAGQAQLGTFGLSAESVKKLTPAMNDLVAATAGYNATTDSSTQMANLMGKVMTGNVGALTRYGVTLDENQKKLLKEGDEMTRASVLAEVMAQNYGGFNEKLAQTPQGQVKQLSNSFGDLKESFGAFLAGEGDLDSFFNNLNSFFDNVVNLITSMGPQVIEGVSKLLQTVMAKLPEMIASLMPTISEALVQLTVAFVEALPAFTQALIDIIIALANAIITNLPTIIQALTNAIIGIAMVLTSPENLTRILQAGVTLLMELVKAIPQILVALIGALPQIITNIVSFFLDPGNLAMIINAAIQLFMGLVMAVPQILGALLGAFGTLVGNLWNGITQMFGQFAANFGNFIGGIFRNAINGVLTFIENFINGPIDLLNGFIDAINGAFGFIGVNIGKVDRIQLPRLATGGLADGATTAIIGEAGKEAVLPLENNTDNWAGLLANTLVQEMEQERIGGSGVTIENQEFIINNQLDAQDIGRVMMQSIRRAA